MITANEAHKIILENVVPLGEEALSLCQTLFRRLASPIFAPICLPPFTHAAMDGFAVRSGDTKAACLSSPVSLEVANTVGAGPVRATGRSPLLSNQAVRIMTGAPLPAGVDAVVPFEEAQSEGKSCRLFRSVVHGDNVRKAGEDVLKGQKILEVGERITPRTIALLASVGIQNISVFRQPRVAIISTGSELVEPGRPLCDGEIYNSNGPALISSLQEIGLEPAVVSKVSDIEEDLAQTIQQQLKYDVLITMGGVSAGDYDLVPKVLQKLGARILFHKVAIKPGKPLLFGTRGKTVVFGLPGNPVSAYMVFDRFVRPALLKMMGARQPFRERRVAEAEEELAGTKGKEDYLRGVVNYIGGHYLARSAGVQGSARLLPLARANATLIIPASQEKIHKGESVEIELLEGER
ncbi:MAG: molybdopterin molybdotransferase MoeA [Deltaproteobacteria bacterium]|nr:molybdopterin molybdotransferase MoeA [Deltaproteobacteria bacterium]